MWWRGVLPFSDVTCDEENDSLTFVAFLPQWLSLSDVTVFSLSSQAPERPVMILSLLSETEEGCGVSHSSGSQ